MVSAEESIMKSRGSFFLLYACALPLALGLAGCPARSVSESPDQGPPPPKRPARDPAVVGLPAYEGKPDDPSRIPRKPDASTTEVAVQTILIKHKGAKDAPRARWSQGEALRRALHLSRLARKAGVAFDALARKYSEGPLKERGGTQVLNRTQRPAPLESAALGLGVGQVSDPVEGPSGYYVVRRVDLEELSSAHILIQYKGAKSAPVAITRTKEEARKMAENVQKQATKAGASFAVLASRASDSPSRIRGGALRPMVPGQMPPEYDNYIDALRKLQVGEISAVVETPFGFHVIKRLKLERITASHILIAFNGADATPREERSRRDAEALAKRVRAEAAAEGADFAALARKHSDDEETRSKGGDLGAFARGIMLPRFEQIAFSLRVGQVSDVVETQMGFHIILRTN
jgi:parvulin-like peptidyl-prolyl isomerase